MVARLARGTTHYQAFIDGGKKVTNDIWTINERHHYDTSSWNVDHDKKRTGCKAIKNLTQYFCHRFEADEPKVIYLRKRGCVCSPCMHARWDECKLLVLGDAG